MLFRSVSYKAFWTSGPPRSVVSSQPRSAKGHIRRLHKQIFVKLLNTLRNTRAARFFIRKVECGTHLEGLRLEKVAQA